VSVRAWPALLVTVLLAAAATAGEVRRGLTAPSPHLGRAIPYTLYTPDNVDRVTAGYPVLYLLHGHGGTEEDWVEAGRLQPTLDRLITAGTVPPMLVVMPGMGSGWYVDNPDPGGSGALETAFIHDLVPHIDRTWRTDARREARAVAGLSMGGWGAVRFAMRRPDLFAAAASLSGALVPEPWTASPVWAGLLADGFGSPVDLARFRAASPFTLIPAFAAAASRPAVYLACGDDDELELAQATLLFYEALHRAGIPVELRISDGGHNWEVWARELEPMLRFAAGAFSGAP
jgi:S-formylglutathione hydrolase FrmB